MWWIHNLNCLPSSLQLLLLGYMIIFLLFRILGNLHLKGNIFSPSLWSISENSLRWCNRLISASLSSTMSMPNRLATSWLLCEELCDSNLWVTQLLLFGTFERAWLMDLWVCFIWLLLASPFFNSWARTLIWRESYCIDNWWSSILHDRLESMWWFRILYGSLGLKAEL